LDNDRKTGYDYQNVPELREDDHPSGKRSVLADALPGLQGEGQAGRKDHQGMPEMRPGLYIPFRRTAMAEILSGVPGRTKVTANNPSEKGGKLDGY
jgi:hypothetical protein